MAYTLRPYQSEAQNQLLDWFYDNKEGNPIVDACVGSGKSLLIADLLKTVMEKWPNQRVIMIVASRELVRQNHQALLDIWPEAPVGIHSAGLRKKDIFNQIIFASIGSVAKKAMQLGRFDIGLIDECHNINTKKTGMYREFIHEMEKINPLFRVIGYTGTPYRGNGVWLHKGKDALFNDIAVSISMRRMLDEGYLCPLTIGETKTKIDASGVGIRNGDYILSQLSKVADNSELIKSRGISSTIVHGKTPVVERDKHLADFKSRKIRCMVNCMVLTVGWNNPATDLIALLRNTKSPVLYVQIAGRGMRLHPDKENCLWLDFTDTTSELGPVDQLKGRDPVEKKATTDAPVKICVNPLCQEPNPAGVKYCKKCDTPFPENAPILNRESSKAQILSTIKIPPKKVSRIFYYHHKKKKSDNASLRVEYLCGMNVYKEWIPLESKSMFASAKSKAWWANRSTEPMPDTVNEALQIIQTTHFKEPEFIETMKDGKYDTVSKYHF